MFAVVLASASAITVANDVVPYECRDAQRQYAVYVGIPGETLLWRWCGQQVSTGRYSDHMQCTDKGRFDLEREMRMAEETLRACLEGSRTRGQRRPM